jgi:hypothetical protein
MGAPALVAFLVDGLMVVAGIADIMVARHSPKPHVQTVLEFGGIPEILFDVGAGPREQLLWVDCCGLEKAA